MQNNSIKITPGDTIIVNNVDIDLSSEINTNSDMSVVNHTNWHNSNISTITINTSAISSALSDCWLEANGCFKSQSNELNDIIPQTIFQMCEIYPALKKALAHFKDIYDLVKDDYEVRKNLDE